MRRRPIREKIRAAMATVSATTDHGRRAMLTLAAALMLTVAFFVVAAVLPRDTVFAVEAYSEYVEVTLDESLENRWLIDGLVLCAGALGDLFSDWLPDENEITGKTPCAPLDEIALPGPETIIVLAGGTRVIAERRAQGPLRITLTREASPLSDDGTEQSVGQLVQTATGDRRALPDYVVLHPALENEAPTGPTFTFVGQAEIGRFARLGAEGLLLSGEVSAFEKGKLGSPRHLVERAKLDAGDVVRFVRPRDLNDSNGREQRSGARGFFRHAETGQDGLRVIYQGVADEVSVDRFGTLGYPLRVSWTSRILADPMGLALGVLLTTLALFVSVLSAIVPSWSTGRGDDNDTGKPDSSNQKTGPEAGGTSGTNGEQVRPTEESTPKEETSMPSSPRTLMMAALLGVSLMPTGSESWADQAHVSAGENGQAFLIQSGGACFALSPTHVIGEMGFASLVRQGTGRIHGDAMAVHHFGYDLTLLHVTGEAARLCGPQASALPRDISERLEQASHGSIRVIHPNGSADLLPVALVGHNPTHLRVRPREAVQQIRQGMSGATVLVDNEPVGLLMAVDEEGVGQVLRFDIALRTVDVILAASPSASKIGVPSDTKAAPTPPIEQSRTRVIRATARSIGPDHTADRLVAPVDEGGAWVATFDTLPVEVVLDLHQGEVVATSGVTLVADDPSIDPQALPRRVEIFRTVTREGDHAWRSLGTWTFVKGEASRTFSFPPVRARRLRIVIHANWGAEGQVALARISPILAR